MGMRCELLSSKIVLTTHPGLNREKHTKGKVFTIVTSVW